MNILNKFYIVVLLLFCPLLESFTFASRKTYTLSEQTLLDKVKGAWAGQTIGCSYGGTTEFKFQGAIIQDYIPIPWDKYTVKKWYDTFPGLYDDVYVDLTFVDVFERCGLDAPVDSFAAAFRRTDYPLWHANQMARYNLSQGLKGHESGFWKNNPHAHCIDFQIEADFAGIMSPGLPECAAEICDRVGHLISYGDGWYGGVYVATMYSLAYVESDVETVVKEALRAIPEESQFHKCMSDVIAWHKKFPKNWKRTWFELQNKWSEEIGCPEGIHNTLNIGTKINCAYVIMGLLYGEGDFSRTVDITTRAGQDSDCNPATAAGILGTLLGYTNIPNRWKEALDGVGDIPFDGTYISLNKAYELSFGHACAMLRRNGCKKEDDVYFVPKREVHPVPLEVAFDGLYVRDKQVVEMSIDDVAPLSFTGTGVVLKGYVAGGLPSDYVAEMEVYMDGKLYETTNLPLDVNQRKCELFFCYDCVSEAHTLSFKWKNPIPSGKIWITEIITYDTK